MHKTVLSKVKQKRIDTYIYPMVNRSGDKVEGFHVAMVMAKLYQGLLGKQTNHKTRVNIQILKSGPMISIEQQLELANHLQ